MAGQKIKKTKDTVELELNLIRTPDILLAVKAQKEAIGQPKITIGFAAETQDLIDNAKSKLASKGLDLIVANDVAAEDAGFAVDTNRVIVIGRGGGVEQYPLMSKSQVAERVLDRLIELLG